MRLAAVFSLFLCSLCVAGEARLDALVERFCNGGVVERRAARRALIEVGRTAWPRFRKLLNHDDPDIRRRARLVWFRIVADTGCGWSIPKPDTPYDIGSGLPLRVLDRKTGTEMALLKPGHAVVDGKVYELKHLLYVGVHEVTVSQYGRGRADLMYFHRRDRAHVPIADITRKDIGKFLKDTGLRLPTATEWDYACFAGGVQPTVKGAAEPRPISNVRRNGFGLYDMIGNVAEWCADHTLRGGSHLDARLFFKAKASTRGPHIGFRVVRTATRN